MLTSKRSLDELKKAASREPPKAGDYDADITNVKADTSKRGNDMFVATVVFTDAGGWEWTLTDYLTDTDKGGLKLRNACAARGVLEKFEAGFVEASDLPGPVRIKVKIRKQRGWPDKLEVEDYAPRADVVALRRAG
jgi:hypothetical protein